MILISVCTVRMAKSSYPFNSGLKIKLSIKSPSKSAHASVIITVDKILRVGTKEKINTGKRCLGMDFNVVG